MNTEPKDAPQMCGTAKLHAECIKLTGRSDVFTAYSIKHTDNEMVLVSRKAFKPGTNLIVRMLDFPSSDRLEDHSCVRAMGLAEVRWVAEVMDEDGLAYEMGMRYAYTD
ncbi:MAG: hypothetical protein R6V60_14125 [Desulfobacterales bacterium]|jgi:hypothetical protein